MTKHEFFHRRSLAILLLLSIALSACAEPYEGEPETHHEHLSGQNSAGAAARQWMYCAQEGQVCNFIGTRSVRYNNSRGSIIVRTMTNGVQCSSQLFWMPFSDDNFCEVLTEVEAGAGMDMSMMPYINRWRIPPGNPGISSVEIGTTSEQPAPYEIGAFRTSCEFSHMTFDDPIVFPGQPGKAHLHAFFGNTGTDAFSTSVSLHASGNSTCRGGIANRSAYWVPAVVDKNGVPLTPHSAQIYYKTGYAGIRPSDVQVFPQGLRMIAGDAKAKGPGQEHAFWSCETYDGHPSAVPDCPPGDRVMMMIQFPQCWSGEYLDSADHKSHMAYPMDGGCPSTHPIPIPEITFNIYYVVPPGTRSSEWRLSSDMYEKSLPGGYSTHGDWFEGWDRDVAETFVKNCDQASKDCKSHLLGDGRMIFSTLESNP